LVVAGVNGGLRVRYADFGTGFTTGIGDGDVVGKKEDGAGVGDSGFAVVPDVQATAPAVSTVNSANDNLTRGTRTVCCVRRRRVTVDENERGKNFSRRRRCLLA
jgi:hypothetical protein